MSQGQNQGKPTHSQLSEFYIFKMDHRTRRYLKDMNRNGISDTYNDLKGSWHLTAILFSVGSDIPAVVYPCLYVLGRWDRGQKADYGWLQGLPAKLDKPRTCHIHTLTQMASLGIFRGEFYEQKRGSWEKQGTFSALCSTIPRKSYVFSSLISLSPPSLKPMTSKILFNWQVSILVLPEWGYGIRACLWNTPFSLGSWDTSWSWFTTECSGYSFLGLFAGSSSPWPLTMRH